MLDIKNKNILKGVIEALNEINAKDIVIKKFNYQLYDFAVNATISSSRQMRGLLSKFNEKSQTYNFKIRGYEGHKGCSWLLVDLDIVIVNLFTEEERRRIDFETVWSNMETIDLEILN